MQTERRGDPRQWTIAPTQGKAVALIRRKNGRLNCTLKEARAYFESSSHGCWRVEDVSRKPDGYDLLCVKGAQSLRVEVKGTVSAGNAVFLTRNEVEQASLDPGGSTLFVLSNIQAKKVRGKWKCQGGDTRVLENWNPRKQGRLKPTQYEYTLPSDEQ